MADDDDGALGAAEGGGTQEDRISRVEHAIDRLADQVSKLIPASHAQAQAHTERRLDRPSSIEEQVQSALRQAREAERAETERAEGRKDRETVAARLARLEEKPPAPAVRAVESLMGWR